MLSRQFYDIADAAACLRHFFYAMPVMATAIYAAADSHVAGHTPVLRQPLTIAIYAFVDYYRDTMLIRYVTLRATIFEPPCYASAFDVFADIEFSLLFLGVYG